MSYFNGLGLLDALQEQLELRLVCAVCSIRQNESTFVLRPWQHTCKALTLLGRPKGTSTALWLEIRRRPDFPIPAKYVVCWYYKEGIGCERHRNRCTFAWSKEEAQVWTVERDLNLHRNELRSRLLQPKRRAAPASLPAQTILSTRSDILQEYGGEFQEICENCFYNRPSRITLWSPNGICDDHRTTDSLLVHVLIEEGRKTHYREIRPVPALRHLQPCRYILQGLPCRQGANRCNYAHSEVEMMVWEAERRGQLSRYDLLPPLTNGLIEELEEQKETVFYCRVCLVTAESQEQFERHCTSPEHTQMMSDDTLTIWKYRTPPCGKASFVLCASLETCVYGEGCTNAHSSEELEEWIQRAKVTRRNKKSAEKEGLLSYPDRLIQEYKACSSELLIMAEQMEGVSVSCNQPLTFHAREKKLKHSWTFNVQSAKLLEHVSLLKRDPGVDFSLAGCNLHQRCTYASGSSFYEPSSTSRCSVTVQVECALFGTHEQWLVLDFGSRPVLLQKILLKVGVPELSPSESAPRLENPHVTGERWHSGNRLIIPCLERALEDVDLTAQYKPPALSLEYSDSVAVSEAPIARQNYRKRMHKLLFAEELSEEKLVSKLSLVSSIVLTEMKMTPYGMKFAVDGERFAEVSVTYSLTPDTDEGYLLKRSVQTALLSLSPSTDKRVYEVLLDHESTDRSLWLQIPQRCCKELELMDGTPYTVELQFQTDRQQFCYWHQAVDLLLDEKLILPDISSCSIPLYSDTASPGNEKQKQAISFITGRATGTSPVPPLVIYGPFGTGKTYTLAKAAMEVIKEPGTRVLICSHTNSAADLYVREHFHPYVTNGHPEAVPVRIIYSKRKINSIDEITLKYCCLSEDQTCFLNPPTSVLKRYRVVITTTSMSRSLKVPKGYFSHILIDEAAQMLECEALIPLAHADRQTRIVLAGDHMQVTPKLFCLGDGQLTEYTLLNRLFHYYQQERHEVARKSRIIFHQNYRCTTAIIQFVSKHFYIGDGNAIEACGAIPSHPDSHPLVFCHTHGVCEKDGSRTSWMNAAEIMQVREKVQEVVQNWPHKWGPLNKPRICVLSQGMQVHAIRQELRKVHLADVTVENYENIPGREFRVIVISTVHTRESIANASSSSPNLEFFNEARVLNTAMTRAQSQVIVIGDAVALCSFGKCSKIWKHYIQECMEHDSVYPEDFTIEQIKRAITDQEVWNKGPDDDWDGSSDTDSWTSDFDVNADDPILQELLDSSRDARVTVTQEGFLDVESGNEHSKPGIGHYTSFPPCTLRTYLEMQPKLYKRCDFVKEGFEKAYALSLDESPPLHILINGRVNCGMAFSGDEVVVQILSSSLAGGTTHDLHGKVVGVLSKAESQQTFVCTMDPHDTRLMVPINHSVSKIFAPGLKDKRDVVPIRVFKNERFQTLRTEKITEETKRTRLFVVQIICWREGFYYPLGIVTKILPLAVTVEQGLKILDVEYELDKPTSDPVTLTKEMAKIRNKFSLPLESLKDCRNFLTFTIDPKGASDLDDAISIRDLGSHYEVGVHIADVASSVAKGSALDDAAKRRGATYYSPGRDPLHMFPSDLSQDLFSLLPQKDRRVISLFVVAEKDTDLIVKGTFSLSLINSDRQLAYEEAEEHIKNCDQSPLQFDTVEDCIAVLYRFSTVHRKCRLQEDCYYDQLDEDCSPGNRRANQMIAELMIMFNSFVAEFLSSKNQTKDLMPLRCQNAPNLQRVIQFKNKHSHLIPLSIHLSHHVGSEPMQQVTINSEFVMLTPLWEFLQSVARSQDFHKIIDLLATDDLHPKLAHVCLEFRKLLGRSSFSRSGSTEQSKTGHYSLQIESYTWASSPIRRYIDVVVQRHLHSTLCKKQPEYLPTEIDFLCHDFSRKYGKSQAYEKRAYSLQLAMHLQGQAQQKLAFVMTVESRCFGVLFPLNHDTLPDCIKLNYSILQLANQPAFNPISSCTSLTWRRRVYSVDPEKELNLQHTLLHDRQVTSFTPAVWEKVLKAIRNEQLEDVVPLLCHGRIQSTVAVGRAERSRCAHYMEVSLEMHAGSTVTLQLTSSVLRGFLTPSVQVWTVAPGFDICVEHAEKPIECFTEYATLAPKPAYKDFVDYRRVWKPLSAMESATSAVVGNSNIVLHDVSITWSRKQQPLLGSFKLSKDFLRESCIKADLNHCYLCIRLENLKPNAPVENFSNGNLCQTLSKLNLSGEDCKLELDPSTYTWVAHGLTGCFDESSPDRGIWQKVDFELHRVSMTTIPSQVFQDASRYTVEIIPQLLPDVRKELAIEGLQWASNLTKCIALGRYPQQMGQPPISKILQQKTFNVFDSCFQLNDSQNLAISRALRDPFTLIQGPPGTGKTMVGVHIVYWFHKLNQEVGQKQVPVFGSVEGQVNQCVLYCGPSNKSVDVVAGMLLSMKDVLRPLRVYSEQMEVVDFPYPGSSMHISQKSLHDGRPQQALRSITLHHRIRMPTNEYHADILDFDKRIRLQEEMSLQDIKDYKFLLNKAREVELLRHDVILCTCCTASQYSLSKIHAKQILIDECGMCTEPETLIPLVSHKKAEKVILLGDHKQLRPVVQDDYCCRLGMEKSLFERYCNRALMLNIQYRMHMDICNFPSEEFYEGRLKTWDQLRRCGSVFYHTRKACCTVIFGHVEGKEQSLVVSTQEGNENSKANAEEAVQVVRITKQLTLERSILPRDIAILTPYNAQVGEINKRLQKEGLHGINVSTIAKSQGSEWRYVVLSTVRSCSQYETDRKPTKSWLQKNLGFVTDPNQVNVALTRAQEGLCILGNRHLLICCSMWRRLLDHYRQKNASVLAHEIQVRR